MAEEKSTPKRLKDLEAGAVKDAFDLTRSDWDDHSFQALYAKLYEDLRWFEGDQYGYYTGTKNAEWFNITEELLEREVKNVYNRILPMIRQQHGDLIIEHEFYTVPATDESADRRAAAVGSIIIEQSNYMRAFLRKMIEAKLLVLLLGNCYWKEWWNKRLNGLAWGKNGATVVKGDLDYAVVSPFNFRPDPHALCADEWRYVVEGKRLPTRTIEAEFGLAKGSIGEENYTSFEESRFTRHGLTKPKEPSAVRLEYWEFASAGRPEGRFQVVCGDWLLYDGPNPTPDARRNYGHFGSGIPIVGTQFHQSMVEIAKAPQRQINRHGSMVDEHFQNFRAKGMLPWGSLRPGDEQAFRHMGGVDFVEYNPRSGTPFWQNPPPLPDSSILYSQVLESEFEVETSVRKPSYGQIPKYGSRPSNQLFQSLVGRDASVMQPTLATIDSELVAMMKVRLAIAQKHYKEPRLIKNTGKGRMPAVRSFIGSDLRDSTDVMVVPGVDIFTTRQRREDVAMRLAEMRAIDAKTALELMRFKGVESLVKEGKVDEYQCVRHLEKMVATSAYIPADPSDNHEFAFAFVNDYRKGEEFEELDKKVQGFIIDRLNEHKDFLRQMAPKPAAEPAPGAGATAGLPSAEAGAAAAPAPGGLPIPEAAAGGGGVPPELIEALQAQIQGGIG